MIDEMAKTVLKTLTGYRMCGQPVPPLEFVMTPAVLKDLKKEAELQNSFLFMERMDGRFEFMNHLIREDSNQQNWIFQPIQLC